jgi:hypothetical protein
MADPLSNSWTKFHWASQHMTAVNKALQRSLDTNLHAVTFETKIEAEARGARAVIAISALPRLRDDCGLTIGDVIQNFRAALDYLAWDLVRTGSTPHPVNPRLVQFPMATSFKAFRSKLAVQLPGVSSDFRAIIRRYQPYRSGDNPTAIRWLCNFSNMDKHRVLIPTLVNVSEVRNLNFSTSWPIEKIDLLITKPQSVNVGTDIAQVVLRRASGDCQVNVQGDVALFPSLGYARNIIPTLTRIRSAVLQVLTEFDGLI